MAEAFTQTDLQGALPLIARGKVRDLYEIDDKTLLFVATDRISAYDVIMENVLSPPPYPKSTLTQNRTGYPQQRRPPHLVHAKMVLHPDLRPPLPPHPLPDSRPAPANPRVAASHPPEPQHAGPQAPHLAH